MRAGSEMEEQRLGACEDPTSSAAFYGREQCSAPDLRRLAELERRDPTQHLDTFSALEPMCTRCFAFLEIAPELPHSPTVADRGRQAGD
jgi:hypothetical protein